LYWIEAGFLPQPPAPTTQACFHARGEPRCRYCLDWQSKGSSAPAQTSREKKQEFLFGRFGENVAFG